MTTPTDLIAGPDRPRRRVALATGAAGLVAGLALGVTGLASAAGGGAAPTPAAPGSAAAPQDGDHFRHGPGRGHGPGGRGGLVTALSGNTLTVDTPGGIRTVTLNDATTYYDGSTKASRSVLAVGEIVAVRPVDPAAATVVAKNVVVLPAHVAGWVSTVDGSTVTLTDPAGFTRTVTTSSATTYRKDGAAGTSAEVTKGTFIRAVGKVAADGTTLAASQIATGHPAPPAGGPGHGGFDDGPAGAGPAGAPPADGTGV